MMVLVMKLSGFAWHVYDGQMPAADIKSATQLASRVEQMPGLIAFLGYACVSYHVCQGRTAVALSHDTSRYI